MTTSSTLSDWIREILAAAEERGWAVVLVDSRAGLVVLEDPYDTQGITIRLSGRRLDAAFVRALPEASRPVETIAVPGPLSPEAAERIRAQIREHELTGVLQVGRP